MSVHEDMTIRPQVGILGVALLFGISSVCVSSAQEQGGGPSTSETASEKDNSSPRSDVSAEASGVTKTSQGTQRGLVGRFVDDQREIWTSPARLRFTDTEWLVPLSGITAGLFVTDRDFSKHLSQSPTTISHYKTLSNAGVAALVGGAGGMWLLGHAKHNEHWSETGFLAGEAALDSLVAAEGLKYSLRRDRPFQAGGSGAFFQGRGTSFPSEHATAAWAVAGVVAHEYPGPFTKIMVYGLASLVSVSRVKAHQHFPSDVLVGSVIGNLVAQNIYGRHHDSELGGASWESLGRIFSDERSHSSAYMGSPYVPLDSWVYPALDRLIALGYIHTAILGLRPWTRLECARLVSEAADHYVDGEEPSAFGRLYESLSQEFAYESKLMAGEKNGRAQLESVYARFTNVSGPPLTDNYHFGQTILNDFGRPYERGFSSVEGISAWTAAGPFVIYMRGEYQHAPSAPAPSQAVLAFISGADGIPPGAPATPIATTNRFRLLDWYVGMSLANWQMSFGKESLWWGPNEGGPFLFSDNAEPITMFRISRNSPFRLPGIFRILGDIRMEFFTGQLSGHQFLSVDTGPSSTELFGQFGQALNPQPFIDGQKVSFNFTRNFEFGISKTDVFSGKGIPFTAHKFLQSVFFFGSTSNGFDDFGDGRTAVDFSYRIPKLRDWLTFYGDAFSEDEISPLGYPKKSVFQAGLYMPKLPGLSKLDLRMEGGSTVPPNFPECRGCFYQNSNYLNSYTTNGALIGAGIGRAAQAEEIRSDYWLSPKNKIGIRLRHRKVDGRFLPQGGTQNDVSINAGFFIRSSFSVSTAVQYERWQIPLLAAGPQSDVAASVQFTFWPKKLK